MKLVMLYGAPGVGKYTTGKALEQLTGYPLFHNHLTVDLVASVFGFDSPVFPQLREEIWLSVMQRAAAEKLPGLIFTFVFEPTVPAGFFERLSAAVEAAGGTVHPVELHCEPDENFRRVQSPDRARYLKLRDPSVVRGGIERGVFLAPGDLPGAIRVDITDSAPNETARLIVERLGLS